MSTPDWFTGPLLSRHFVDEVLPRAFAARLDERSIERVHRKLRRWLQAAQAALGPASGLRTIGDVGARPFFASLGYTLRTEGSRGSDGDSTPAPAPDDVLPSPRDPALLLATLEGPGGALPLVIAPWHAPLDRTWRVAVRAGIDARQRWALGFNGRRLRLIDVDRPYARRYLELDLAETIADVRRVTLLCAVARPEAFADIVAACDAHGVGVREALQGGVRDALELLCAALARAAHRDLLVSSSDVVSQALTLLYRLLFLLFAEARALVPVWHPIYRDSYAIGTLQRQAERESPRGLWEALQAVSRLAHAGCETDEFSMTAFNSQLFSPEHTPLADRARIDSATVARVLQSLTTTPGHKGRGRERITYADLGVEQLGAVYERILDYAPQLEKAAVRLSRHRDALDRRTHEPTAPGPASTRSAAPVPLVRTRRSEGRPSVRRKESGTFYTPRGLADYLVRQTLGPLTMTATADRILSLRVLDPAMGSGAFLVSACHFLARAYEQARAREDRPLPATEAARADVRRTIARQCLFGVDLNPMAVQLARLSLWLTTLTTDAPLTFLDHHLRVGNSLIGASLDDLARRLPARATGAASRRRAAHATLPLFSDDDTARLMCAILPAREQLAERDESPDTVHGKERLLDALLHEGALAPWLRLADLWCASWFWPTGLTPSGAAPGRSATGSGPAPAPAPPPQAAWPALSDHVLHGRSTLPSALAEGWLAQARAVAADRRFFHWTLEFPEVFFDASGRPRPDGGFDAVIGNPPWDMVRNDARAGGERETADRAGLARFVRETGIYDAGGDAHLNSYQLFVDRSLSLVRRDGGRMGLIVPWGLAADHGSARLRRRLLEACDVETMISFENREGLFPIHRGLRFVLFACTTGRPTTAVRCRFGEHRPDALDRLGADRDDGDDWRSAGAAAPARGRGADAEETSVGSAGGRTVAGRWIAIAPALLRRVSGEGLAFPDVRSREGLALVERMHASWPSVTDPDGWDAAFSRELNVTDDRRLFVPAGEPDASLARARRTSYRDAPSPWPVIEGKHVHPFVVRAEDARFVVAPEQTEAVRARVPGALRHRLAYRDVSSASNRQTLIAAILPPFVVSTHTLFCLAAPLDLDAQHCLCALMNSFVANYLVRLRVSTHVTVALLHHLPMPKPLRGSPLHRALAGLAAELSMAAAPAPAVRAARVRLQALAALAYGLTEEELSHVLGTFPLVPEAERLDVFEAFRRLGGSCEP